MQRMDVKAIRHLARGAADQRIDAGDPDRNPRMVARSAVEHRIHQGELVEATFVCRLLAGLEGMPNGSQATNVIGEARYRLVVRHRVAPLDVSAHLGTEPEIEPSGARLLHVPRGLSHRHGAARERHRDVGAELQALGSLRSERDRQERVMACFERPGSIESHALVATRLFRDRAKTVVTELGIELHTPPPKSYAVPSVR